MAVPNKVKILSSTAFTRKITTIKRGLENTDFVFYKDEIVYKDGVTTVSTGVTTLTNIRDVKGALPVNNVVPIKYRWNGECTGQIYATRSSDYEYLCEGEDPRQGFVTITEEIFDE